MEAIEQPGFNSHEEVVNDLQRESYDVTLKILAVVGLLVVLLGGTFIGFRAISYIPTVVSTVANSFSGIASLVLPLESIEVHASSYSLKSGSPVGVSWRHIGKDDEGSYSIFYPCSNGLYFTSSTPTGKETIFCNAPFNIVGSENSITLTPFLSGTDTVEIPVTIQFVKNGRKSASLYTRTSFTVSK